MNFSNQNSSQFSTKISFKVLTIFPELFPGILAKSITGDALEKKIWQIQAINIRDYAFDARGTVDDIIYGGGAGMLLKADVLGNAIQSNLGSFTKNNSSENFHEESKDETSFQPTAKPKIIYLSPRGKMFNQKMAQELAQNSEIMILCGRYEGVDQRVLDEFAIEEISIGDYVLSGGEIACYVFIDAILRNIPFILGAQESLAEESFGSSENSEYENLLEYPHYTRPAVWRDLSVPEVLLSGHHKKINNWRKERAIEITKLNRPDLYKKYIKNS